MLLLLFLTLVYSSPVLFTDLTKGRIDGYKSWCEIHLDQTQAGWSPRQPPEEWTNITMIVFENTNGIQITTCKDEKSCKVPSAYIVYYNLNDRLIFSVCNFGYKLVLYLGWNATGEIPPDLRCWVDDFTYGKHV
jgi:hypothetical protein